MTSRGRVARSTTTVEPVGGGRIGRLGGRWWSRHCHSSQWWRAVWSPTRSPRRRAATPARSRRRRCGRRTCGPRSRRTRTPGRSSSGRASAPARPERSPASGSTSTREHRPAHRKPLGRPGRLLTSVTFQNESASGWQAARLASPVALQTGRWYVVSYHAPAGRYAADPNYFRNRMFTSGVLQARAGVYAYGSEARYPTRTWRNASYYADVLFAPGTEPTTTPTTPAPTTPPPTTTPAPTTTAPPPPTTTPPPITTLSPTTPPTSPLQSAQALGPRS